MSFLEKLQTNDFMLVIIIFCVLIMTEITKYSRKSYYQKSDKIEFQSNPLICKYHLDEQRNTDIDKVNKYFSALNFANAGLFLILGLLISVPVGLIAYVIVMAAGNYAMAAYIGKNKEKFANKIIHGRPKRSS